MGMDPMQRQLLEVAYECFENGLSKSEISPDEITAKQHFSWRSNGEATGEPYIRLYWRHDR